MDIKKQWTRELVAIEALQYMDRTAFHYGCPGGYKHSLQHDYIDDICKHMNGSIYGFKKDKPAIIYYIEFLINGAKSLYKIGITNRDTRIRLGGMGLKSGVKARIIKEISFNSGAQARAKEKELHGLFSKFKYIGEPIMANGNTELFTHDVLCASYT